MNKKRLLTRLFVLVCFCAACAASSQAAEKPVTVKEAEEEIPTIVFGAEMPEEHQEVEASETCMECHTIKADAVTTATQRYLKGTGTVLEKGALWKEIVEFFGERQSCVLATCVNNEPCVTTIDMSLDPVNKVFYALSEKGTRKLGQMTMNPKVAVEFHKQQEWQKMIFRCLQMSGRARVFDAGDPEFDKGLTFFKQEREKISVDTIKRGMDMTCFTPAEILFYDVLRKDNGANIFQLWER